MASLPLAALRPLAFPSHRWHALVCLRTGRVLALLPSTATADAAVCAQTRAEPSAPLARHVRQVPAKSLPF